MEVHGAGLQISSCCVAQVDRIRGSWVSVFRIVLQGGVSGFGYLGFGIQVSTIKVYVWCVLFEGQELAFRDESLWSKETSLG